MNGVRLAVSAAIIGAGLIASAPTIASAGNPLCSANRVCIYDSADWVGLLGERAPGNARVNVATAINDKTSSWENKTTTNARWYEAANGTGQCHTMNANREDNFVGLTDNDTLTSWATNGAC
jgi:hypothetical protein